MTKSKKAAEKPAKKAKPKLSVSRGANRPPRILIYGENGVGKTKLAADIGEGIIIDCEDGAGHVPVDRFQWEDGRTRPKTLDEIYDALRLIYKAGGDYDTVIIDGMDELERLIWEKICSSQRDKNGQPYKSIEQFGYGKGYTQAGEELRRFADVLESMGGKGFAVVLVGHASVATVRNPMGEDYDKFTLMMHKNAAGFLFGWVDICAFMEFETAINNKPGTKGEDAPKIANYTNTRVLHLESAAGYTAKARSEYEIPAEFVVEKELPWQPIREALEGKAE